MNWSSTLQEKCTGRTTLVFVVLSWLCILGVFRAALWGGAILAPLDIGATLYTKFKWIDPALGGVPRNHYFIDMFDFGLPRTYLAHQALQAGEFPWWEPYSDGGRPLAMETHLSLADPVRLVMFRLFPFVPAYNWTRILQCFLGGLSMFVLLRFLKFPQFTTILGALSFQFAGLQALFFYPENVTGSIIYYPLLWAALAKYAPVRPGLGIAAGGLLCGAVLMSGSQQSHAYLVLFLLCFAVGYGWSLSGSRRNLLVTVGGAFLLGCCLAAPIVIPQTEMFLASRVLKSRGIETVYSGWYWLTGVYSLIGIFPWVAGSFRSLDLGRLFDQQGAAYAVFLGTPVMVLAIMGVATWRKAAGSSRPEINTALLLVLTYFVGICSTPLINLLYQRAAGLAVLGLLVLAGAGLQQFAAHTSAHRSRILWWVTLLIFLAVVLAHLFAFAFYPRIKEKVLKVALRADTRNPYLGGLIELRTFQVNNLPNDITFKNPEPLLAFLGLLCLGLAYRNTKARGLFIAGVFVFNLLPLLSFFGRFTPYSPVKHWHALLKGGPEQQAVMKLAGRDLRIRERTPNRYGSAFPGVTICYYRIHSLDGWTSFPLHGRGQTLSPRGHNILYSSEPASEHGMATVISTNQLRFVWADEKQRDVSIVTETANSIRLRIGAGPAGELIRTDTYYPGWRVEAPSSIGQRRNADGFLSFSIPADPIELVLRYQPSYHVPAKLASLAALLAIVGLLVASRLRSRPVIEHLSPAVI
jgi:hypothetical protein